jgi:TonB family protein
MAPLIKDAVAVTNSAASTTVSKPTSPASKAPASGGLRADAVSLEVPVRVYGSRVTQLPGQAESTSDPFEEQTTTMIVFPQGCVLRMSTTVSVGQMLVVTNAKSKQDAICRVVKVRTFSNTQGYVEVEFTTAQTGYWSVNSGSEAPVIANPAPSAPPVAAPLVTPAKSATQAKPAEPLKPVAAQPPDVARKPAQAVSPALSAIPVAPAPPPTQAKVAPVAASPAATIAARVPVSAPALSSDDEELNEILNRLIEPVSPPVPAAPVAAPEQAAPAVEKNRKVPTSVLLPSPLPAIDFPAVAPPPPEVSLTISELRGDALPEALSHLPATSGEDSLPVFESSATKSAPETPRRAFGSFSGGQSLTGGTLLSTQPLSSVNESEASIRLDASNESRVSVGGDYAEAPKQNHFLLIAACVMVLFVAAGAGVFYFRANTGNAAERSAVPSVSAATPVDAEPTGVTSEQTALRNSATGENPRSAQPGVVSSTPVAPANVQPNPTDSNNAASAARAAAIARQAQAKTLAGIVDATSNAHPVTAQRTEASELGSAPSVDGGPVGNTSLSGIVSANDGSALKAPEIRPEGPIRVGGNVKEPRLLSSVMPTYPLAAKEAGIQGDVVVQATIDQRGNVADMKIVSGPIMLRQPALDALRRWKYSPTTLNGSAISLQMLVTIKFSRP